MEDLIKKEKRLNALIDTVCYWLGYQTKIGRAGLIHEASLRYPVADAMTAKGIEIDRIILEQLHPSFKKRFIDLALLQENQLVSNSRNNYSNIQELYEFKLAKYETSIELGEEHQRVFNDIVRLAYYNLWNQKECYFLMCGSYGNFKTYFVGQENRTAKDKKHAPVKYSKKDKVDDWEKSLKEAAEKNSWNPLGIYKDWFGFKINEEKRVTFRSDTNNFGLKLFQKNYKRRTPKANPFKDSFTIKTKCIDITPSGLENAKTHAAGLWKIEAIDTNN